MITIRTVAQSEIDSIKKFIKKIFPDAMLSFGDDDLLLLAESDTKPVGFAHIIDDDDRLILQGIGVDNSMRGKGIGTLILEYVLDMLADESRPIYLKVKLMNPAIDLYSRHGFFLQKFGDSHVLVKKSNS